MEYIVIIGFIVHQVGGFVYLRDTWYGKTQPNRVSFLLWGVAPLIGAVAALSDGVTWAVLPVFAAGVGPFLVFFVSFVNKKAYWKITRFDWVCAALSVLALILWQVTQNPVLAIVFALLADGAASLPVIRKSWTHPHSETAITYLAVAFNQLTAFLVMKEFSFVEMAFPVYIFVICMGLFILITIGQKRSVVETA